MRKIQLCFASLASVVLLAGCASTSGLGERTGGARLPTGAALLRSNKEECTGAVHVGPKGKQRSELAVQRGENATFVVKDEDELEWTCVAGSSADRDRVNCPNDTTHVRVTRAATGGDLLFECYGK